MPLSRYRDNGVTNNVGGILIMAVMLAGICGQAIEVGGLVDTLIASSSSQGVDLGGVFRNRMKYVLPAAALFSS